MSIRSVALVACASLIVISGCAKPPEEEITKLNQTFETAQQGDAAEYAPESLRAAADAKQALDVELKAQEETWSVRRSYDKAKELALDAERKAAAAIADGQAARDLAQQQATDDLAALQASVAETRAMLDAAPVGKGTQADLAALRGDLDGVELGLADLEASIAEGRYKEAIGQVQAAQGVVETVRADIQRATELASQKRR